MIVRVHYRIDAHEYDPRHGRCAGRCAACQLEGTVYRSAEAAEAAQPARERARAEGDQGALDPPARRFAVVVEDFSG
jgi:hypothetical protein